MHPFNWLTGSGGVGRGGGGLGGGKEADSEAGEGKHTLNEADRSKPRHF